MPVSSSSGRGTVRRTSASASKPRSTTAGNGGTGKLAKAIVGLSTSSYCAASANDGPDDCGVFAAHIDLALELIHKNPGATRNDLAAALAKAGLSYFGRSDSPLVRCVGAVGTTGFSVVALATGAETVLLAPVLAMQLLVDTYSMVLTCGTPIVKSLGRTVVVTADMITRFQMAITDWLNSDDAWRRTAARLVPDKYNFSVLPAESQKLLAGFLALVKANKTPSPLQTCMKLANAKLGEKQAGELARAILIANKMQAARAGTQPTYGGEADAKDIQRLVREYSPLSLGGAFLKLVDALRLSFAG